MKTKSQITIFIICRFSPIRHMSGMMLFLFNRIRTFLCQHFHVRLIVDDNRSGYELEHRVVQVLLSLKDLDGASSRNF